MFELACISPIYQNANIDILSSKLAKYSEFSKQLLSKIEFIFVDDGSPFPAKIPSNVNLNVTLLRILEDIPWNPAGAKNLGVFFANSDKVLSCDADVVFSEDTLNKILSIPLNDEEFYQFNLKETGQHQPSTILLKRRTFMKFNGNDEKFSGHYGYDDLWLSKWLQINKIQCKRYEEPIISIPDHGGGHTLVRDSNHNAKLFNTDNHTRRNLNFSWECVECRKLYAS